MNPTEFLLGEIERLSRLEKAATNWPWHECYALFCTDDDGFESASFYPSKAARDTATLEEIWFGGPDEEHKEEAESYLNTLREKGVLTFEGDPPLRWETMVPERGSTETRNSLPGLLSALLVMTKSLEHDMRCSGSFANDVLTEAAKALGYRADEGKDDGGGV